MRVLLACDSLVPSGVGVHMLTLANALRHLGYDPQLALVQDRGTDSLIGSANRQNLLVYTVKDGDWGNVIAQANPDLVHIHAGIGWEGHEITHAANMPIVRTEHLPWLLTDANQIREYATALGRISALICVAPSAREAWSRAISAMPGPKLPLATIANGIAPQPLAGHNKPPSEPAVILSVGRMTVQKQHATLLIAFARLLKGGAKARLHLAGDGALRDRLERLARRLRIDGEVLFLGNRDDVPKLMAESDILAMPSAFEGLPLTVLEAMAAGLPVIATKIGGNLDALGADHPFLVPPGHARALAETLARALAAPKLSAETARRQAKRQQKFFTDTRMAEATARIYQKALRAQQGGGMDRVRLGFIGAGGIAHRHFDVLSSMPDVEIAAIADPDLERARAAAERFGAKAYGSHEDMLAAETLDAAYICIPPFAHGAPEQACLDLDLPFFVEKPLSLDLELAERISEQVERSALITAVGYHWRYLDTMDEARRHLAGNPPHLIQGFWIDQTPPPDWWWREDKGGGQIIEQATHVIDAARFLAGDVIEVFGVSARRDRPDFNGLTVPTASAATLKFASGAIASLGATCLLRWNHRVGIHVFSDTLALELTDHDLMVDVGQGRPVRSAEGDPVWREDRDFIEAVMGRENRIRCPYPEALKTHRVALAVSRSARDGAVVKMEGLRADPQPMFRQVATPGERAAASSATGAEPRGDRAAEGRGVQL